MASTLIKKLFIALLLATPCVADQVAVSSFKYLNSNENSTIINNTEAQDLLNVDISPGGKSIKKRPGYGLYKTLSTSQALHGGYHFFDATGNDVQVWGSSTSLYGIVADAAPTQLISSATLNSTWDCADTQGFAYCVTSNRDALIKTNGATQVWSTAVLGTIIEATPDRLAIAGVSGNLNTIYFSASNVFTNYTPAPLTTDPFTEVIASPGSKLTHLRWACNKLLWWKDQSFGYFSFDDQYAAQVKTISDTIGTFDNTSAVDPGGSVWFRGQDGHVWQYDCAGLTKQTIEITPFVQSSGRRTSNSFTQSSQSDWQLGSSSPTYPSQPLSTTISIGDVVPGSFTVTENSNAQWNSTGASNITIGSNFLVISTNAVQIDNNSFESGATTNWAVAGASPTTPASKVCTCGTINPQDGTKFAQTSNYVTAYLINANTGATINSVTINYGSECSWTLNTITVSASFYGFRAKIKFDDTFGNTYTSDAFLLNTNSIQFYANSGHTTGPSINFKFIDNVTNSPKSTITSGSYTSQAFNTGLPYGYVSPTAVWSANTSTPSFVLQKSANGTTGWTDIATSTGVNVATNQPYLRYLSTFTVGATDSAATVVTSVTLLERSSGTYFSQVKNAPNIGAWSTFNPTIQNNGGSHVFYSRSSATPFYVLNSSPAWVAQPANSLVTAAIGAYFQIIDSFTITSATDTVPVLSDFSVNWYEGSATDQAYMLFFDNSIWADVSYGVGVSSNTYIFRRDLINEGWTVYNFGGGGMLVQNNHLFFGDVGATGRIFQYDSGHSDNGNAIAAYWKSKDFTGGDPFLKNSLLQIDTFAKKDQNSTLTTTYTLDTSTTTTNYSIALSSSTSSIIQSRKLLPSGKDGYVFNLKYGDTSTSSNWEVFGFRIGYTQIPYRPSL